MCAAAEARAELLAAGADGAVAPAGTDATLRLAYEVASGVVRWAIDTGRILWMMMRTAAEERRKICALSRCGKSAEEGLRPGARDQGVGLSGVQNPRASN